MQRACNARGLTCTLADLAHSRSSHWPTTLLLPRSAFGAAMGRMGPCGRVARFDAAAIEAAARRSVVGSRSARFAKGPRLTLLLADDALVWFSRSGQSERCNAARMAASRSLRGRAITIAPFTIAARGVRVIPVGIRRRAGQPGAGAAIGKSAAVSRSRRHDAR